MATTYHTTTTSKHTSYLQAVMARKGIKVAQPVARIYQGSRIIFDAALHTIK